MMCCMCFKKPQNQLIKNEKLKSVTNKFKEQTARNVKHLYDAPNENKKCERYKLGAIFEKYCIIKSES